MKAAVTIADKLALPVELAGRRTAVFGISGSGKSNTATVIVEGLLKAGEQVVLVDPKGEGWGLLSERDGRPSNLPLIIFGEPNGHIENLSESHGPRLADFVVDTGRSVVLSLLGFESDQSERRFVSTFLRQLYRKKSRQPHPSRTLVVLDEAHLFVPEHVRGDGAELAGAVQRIVRQGRSFGIGTLLVDQRPQDVSKRVVTQCDTLICHQLTHKTDRDALSDWVKGYDRAGEGKTFLEGLAGMEPGEAWVWSPAWLKLFRRVKIHLRRTFDSGAAPDGSATAKKVRRAEVDLETLKGQLAEIVERAKADDPATLKKWIAELEKSLRAKAAPVADEHALETAYARGRFDERKRTDEACGIAKAIRQRVQGLDLVLDTVIEKLKPGQDAPKTPPVIPNGSPARAPRAPLPVRHEDLVADHRAAARRASDVELGKCERAILQVLAQNPDGCAKRKLALLAGYSYSGGFRNALSTLRGVGLIVGGNEEVMTITDAGLAHGPFSELPTGRALADYWLANPLLGKCERAVLGVLVSTGGPYDAQGLCELTGYEYSGGFRNALSTLRTAGLIQGSNTGTIRAAEELLA